MTPLLLPGWLPITLLCIATLALVAVITSQPWRLRRRRERIAARPFPGPWRRILRHRVPLYRRLPADLQRQLRGLIQNFLAEKAFIGCRGQAIDDDVRVTIAAQACLLQLNRDAGLFPRCRQILVYPGAFVVDREHGAPGGVLHQQRRALLGESWSQGQVILSWSDSLDGALIADDGHNVVLHEFAHQLDQENGAANGAPSLPGVVRRRRWAKVMADEFARLRARAFSGEAGVLDGYGASEPAEFFAVATEVFFERPAELAAGHPALYRELAGLYRVDPLGW